MRRMSLERVQLPEGTRRDCAGGCGETLIGSNQPFDLMAMGFRDNDGRVFCTRGCAAAKKSFSLKTLASVLA